MRARWPRAGLMVRGPIRRPLQGTEEGCKEGIVRGVWSEWEGACADRLCRGGHFRPPLTPETAISAQMQIVMGKYRINYYLSL